MPMKIITRDFGEQEIEEDKIITFPEGVIGFEKVKRYALLSPLGDGVFPMWLQAVDSISDEEQKLLNINEDSPYRCLAVAIVPEDYKKTTINLRCPIIINTNERRAAQVILTEHYEFKAPVYEEV